MPGYCFGFVLVVCLLQLIFIANLVIRLQNQIQETQRVSKAVTVCPNPPQVSNLIAEPMSIEMSMKTSKTSENLTKSYGGVAATLLLHAPTWFQRRYTMMIQNTISNIPDDWVVQIFYTAQGQSKKGFFLQNIMMIRTRLYQSAFSLQAST